MIPSYFDSDVLHPDRLSEESGALDRLFVRIVCDLFKSDYPVLSYHPGGGADGAVDLWHDAYARRSVFECKQIGKEIKQQHWEAARDRWRKVYRLLAENLPLGPDRCRGPYRVWFSRSPCIVKYVYAVSCPVFPIHHKDELRQEIKGAFESNGWRPIRTLSRPKKCCRRGLRVSTAPA